MKALNEIKSLIDQGAGWVRWGISTAFLALVALYVLEALGVRVVSLPNPQILIYVAGIYWLTR
jgi:hypothetical protein